VGDGFGNTAGRAVQQRLEQLELLERELHPPIPDEDLVALDVEALDVEADLAPRRRRGPLRSRKPFPL